MKANLYLGPSGARGVGQPKGKQKPVAWVCFVGRIVGIHESWEECDRSVHGYPGARHKSYLVYEDAVVAWERFEETGEMDVRSMKQRTTQEQHDFCNDIPSPSELQLLVLTGKRCPYCAAPTVLVDSSEVYNGRSYGPIWICRPCRAWVSCHKGTHRALGRLANEELRRLKIAFHNKFDPIWRSGRSGRNELYLWLAKRMGIDKEVCHGGMFTPAQCREAIEALNEWTEVSARTNGSHQAVSVRKKKEDPLLARARTLMSRSNNGTGTLLTTCITAPCTFPFCKCPTR